MSNVSKPERKAETETPSGATIRLVYYPHTDRHVIRANQPREDVILLETEDAIKATQTYNQIIEPFVNEDGNPVNE